jgi:hypothetical protein
LTVIVWTEYDLLRRKQVVITGEVVTLELLMVMEIICCPLLAFIFFFSCGSAKNERNFNISHISSRLAYDPTQIPDKQPIF